MENKAAACFLKCLEIRKLKLGENHPGCSDCLLNLGIVYKRSGYPLRALQAFKDCINIRKLSIGNVSKEVANALEELCKLYIEEHRYDDGFNTAKECYEIRIR
jgi:tetratricopeptide (TPR) repeat protein